MKYVLPCLLLLPLFAAADWTEFRSPGGNAVVKDAKLPVRWSATENLRWKIALPGRGLSCPVIAGDRMFVTACSGPEQKRLHVLCFEAATGKQLWERTFWATGPTFCHEKTCMAAPTPCTDGQHVFALFATFDLVALDRDGNLLWFRSLTRDYPTVGNFVGSATSPILWDDLLILGLENFGESYALGIHKTTGANKWKVERPREYNYTTPTIAMHNGKAQMVIQSPNDLTAYDPATGAKLWAFTGKSLNPIVSPVASDGVLYVPAGPRLYAIVPGSPTELPKLLWESKKLPTEYGSPLHYNGQIICVREKGYVSAADARTGAEAWSMRLEGTYWASPLAADGKIYFVNDEGATTVIEPGPAAAKALAINKLNDTIVASPVAHRDALYLRSDRFLYCIANKQ